FALNNNIYQQEQANIGIQTISGRNTFSVFAFIERQTPLGSAVPDSSNNTSSGINFTWSRSLTPRLNGAASLGYVSTIPNPSQTLTAELGLNYTVNDVTSAFLNYQFVNSDATTNSSYRRNQIGIGVTRSF